ncbi:MAG: TetR/AcrR family transcriptional regulator, partial [Burkholderiaceae bacterium]|nr:TetR/AcrR family transcriptional regulator [Burkholderiaceae bacterium]
KNRRLENRFQWVLESKAQAIQALLGSMRHSGALRIDPHEIPSTAAGMVVILTYWLSYEYVRNPRHALEPLNAQQAMLRGAHHVLNLLMPYLEPVQRAHLLGLTGAYFPPGTLPSTPLT